MMYGPPMSSDEDDELANDNDYEEFMAKIKQRRLKAPTEETMEQNQFDSIWTAISYGKIDTVLEAIKDGMSVNIKLKDDWTPILLAACVGNDEITRELLACGADVNAMRAGSTPLLYACDRKIDDKSDECILKVIKMLVEYGADPKVKDRRRRTPLMLTAFNNNLKALKYLLPLSDREAEDNQRWNALFWAVEGNAIDVVEYLLNFNFDFNKKDIRGNNILNIAQNNGFEEIVKILSGNEQIQSPRIHGHMVEYFEEIFSNEKPQFFNDVARILTGMNSENLIPLFASKKVDLLQLLSMNDKKLENLGVTFSFQRRKILGGLYNFHKHPFHPKSLHQLKPSGNSNIEIASVILTCIKQIIAMEAGLQFLMNNYNKDSSHDGASQKELYNMIVLVRQQINRLRLAVNLLLQQHQKWDATVQPVDLIRPRSRRIRWKNIVVPLVVTTVFLLVHKLRMGIMKKTI